MKTLDEHNKIKLAIGTVSFEPVKNGIACPECNTELMDSQPCVVLLSSPVQYKIHCPFCDYKGYRY